MAAMSPPFEIVKFIQPHAARHILLRLHHATRVGNPRQSGMPLTEQAWLKTILRTEISGYHLRLDRSSWRTQQPDGHGALTLHQDTEALRGTNGWTAWLPLVEIDELTPTLEICPWLPNGVLPHKRDAANYSVLADDVKLGHWPLLTVTGLALGKAVIFGPRTLHRTCVRPWHTKIRHSLDLRFLPDPASRCVEAKTAHG